MILQYEINVLAFFAFFVAETFLCCTNENMQFSLRADLYFIASCGLQLTSPFFITCCCCSFVVLDLILYLPNLMCTFLTTLTKNKLLHKPFFIDLHDKQQKQHKWLSTQKLAAVFQPNSNDQTVGRTHVYTDVRPMLTIKVFITDLCGIFFCEV